MQRNFSKLRAILVQLEFFSTGLPEQRVVVLTSFLTNKKRGLFLLLRLGHFLITLSLGTKYWSEVQFSHLSTGITVRQRVRDYGVPEPVPLPRIYKT